MIFSKICLLAYLLFGLCICVPTLSKHGSLNPRESIANAGPSPSSPDSTNSVSSLFSSSTVPTLEFAFTFVGVVPVVALIAFLTLKLHHIVYHSKQRNNTHPRLAKQGSESPSGAGLFAQWKAELEAGKTRCEMHGDDVRHEKSAADDIKELPDRLGELGSPFCQNFQEMEGEGQTGELEAPHRD